MRRPRAIVDNDRMSPFGVRQSPRDAACIRRNAGRNGTLIPHRPRRFASPGLDDIEAAPPPPQPPARKMAAPRNACPANLTFISVSFVKGGAYFRKGSSSASARSTVLRYALEKIAAMRERAADCAASEVREVCACCTMRLVWTAVASQQMVPVLAVSQAGIGVWRIPAAAISHTRPRQTRHGRPRLATPAVRAEARRPVRIRQ